MKIVIQRVLEAKCTIAAQTYSEIQRGYVLLVGFCESDEMDTVSKLAQKVIDLRLFEDEQGKMNHSITAVEGEIMAISQFTLYADCKKGRRPSFTKAMKPELANNYYKVFVDYFKKLNINIKQGLFQSDMKIQLINDGPCTVILDSEEL